MSMFGHELVPVPKLSSFADEMTEGQFQDSTLPIFYDYRQRGRFVTFGISFGFSKGEAMEFSGQKQF